MKKTTRPKKSFNTIPTVINYMLLTILILVNLYGIYFMYTQYAQITQKGDTSMDTLTDKLIPPLNQSLYNQIKKDRATRQLIDGSTIPKKFNVSEVFIPAN